MLHDNAIRHLFLKKNPNFKNRNTVTLNLHQKDLKFIKQMNQNH